MAHWFGGVFAIIGAIWLVTLMAYAFGAGGVSFGNRYTGQRATIDFMRQYDRPVLALRDGVGLELDTGGPKLHGSIVKLRAGLPVLCWVCGRHDFAGGISQADYRQGDWFYRAPVEHAASTTIAYDRTTGETVVVAEGADVHTQEQALAAHGLAVTENARISPDTLADLRPVSMQREGCVIFNAAFVAVNLLWLVFGGIALAVVRLVKRRA